MVLNFIRKAIFLRKHFFDGAIIAEVTGHGDCIWVATYGRGIHRFSKKDSKWKSFSTQEKDIENDFFTQ